MEQTTVNQYFAARKHSSSIHPSKRLKLDPMVVKANMKEIAVKPKPRKQGSNRKTKSRNNVSKTLSVNALLNASPLIVNTESKDDHQTNLKHKKQIFSGIKQTGMQKDKDDGTAIAKVPATPEKVKVASITPKLSPFKTDLRNNMPVDPVINEQAKIILYSRGNTIARASLKKNVSNVKSPVKASGVLEHLSPRKRNLVNEEQSKVDRRVRLRNKFKHLLKPACDDNSNAATIEVVEEEQNPETRLKKEDIQEGTTTERQRAHEKYKHLTQKAPQDSFVLPEKYKMLLEMFRCSDSILYLLNQRSEICTFQKLKKSVQSMCGRDFDMKHLAMMKTVYPNGFIFRQEKGLHTVEGSKSVDHQLTVEANFKDVMPVSTKKIPSNVLISRRLKFENALLDITKEHHQKYLRKLNLKIDDSEIHRWHPRFKLQDVPDIELASLPKPPVIKGCSSAADILLKNRGHLPKRLEKALEQVAESSISKDKETTPTKSNISDTQTSGHETPIARKESNKSNSKLKGVSQSLLERIRQKEQKKLELQMTRDPKTELKISRMERLPEMVRILKAYFTAEKKVAIPLEDCVLKLSESYGTALQMKKLEDHVRLLNELVPNWLTIAMVRKCPYVKLSKNVDINSVISTIEKFKKQEEAKCEKNEKFLSFI